MKATTPSTVLPVLLTGLLGTASAQDFGLGPLALGGDDGADQAVLPDIALEGGLDSLLDAVGLGGGNLDDSQALAMSDDEDDILDVAKGGGFGTLVDALEASGLAHLFVQPWWCKWNKSWCDEHGQFTVFAPTDEAFAALPEGTLERLLTDEFAPHLKDLLSYHAAEGRVLSGDITDGLEVEMLNGETVVANVGGEGGVTLNGDASVTSADIAASNGVVHAVDRVLLPSSASNIAEVAKSNDLDTLVALLAQVGLDSFVSDPDKVLTVFAPTEDAFKALVNSGFDASDNDAVADLLKYHVVEGEVVTSWDLLKGSVWQDAKELVTVQGSTISADIAGYGWNKELRLNGEVGVAAADVLASNGIVHVVDRVLTPPTPPGDITEVAEERGFSTLVSALTKAELADVLGGDGPFTVFAPTDEAFEEAGIDVDALTKEELAPVLLYHVLAGSKVLSTDLESGIVRTNPGSPTNLVVDVRKGWSQTKIHLNGEAQVIAADVPASNGVVHAIDSVLIPPKSIAELAAGVEDLSTLSGLLADAGLDTALSGEGPFTVFAPTDEAFEVLSGADLTEEELKNVLLYHVTSGNILSSELKDGQEVETLFSKAEGAVPQTLEISAERHWSWYSWKWMDRLLIRGDENEEGAEVTTRDVVAANGIVHVIDRVLVPTL